MGRIKHFKKRLHDWYYGRPPTVEKIGDSGIFLDVPVGARERIIKYVKFAKDAARHPLIVAVIAAIVGALILAMVS